MDLKNKKQASVFGSDLMVARFRAKIKVNPETGCHEWQGVHQSRGYGKIRLETVAHYAHHVAWRLVNGDIPEGMRVLHRCDNPCCVNPQHLFLGTQRDRLLDAAQKGRLRGGPNSNKVTGRNPFAPTPSIFKPMNKEEKRASVKRSNRLQYLKRKAKRIGDIHV